MIRPRHHRRPTSHRPVWAVVVALALVLGACGTTDSDDSGASSSGASATETSSEPTDEGCEDDATATSSEPVTLTDHFGRTVELDRPAQRVAALEWQQAEDVLTLCLTPVAVADIEGYGTWVTAVPMPDGVDDVGNRGEPNIDALVAAEPDLVIVEATAADDAILGQLEGLGVPVLATRGADTADPFAHMLDTFDLIAQATGRTERADLVAAEVQDQLVAGEEQMAGLDLPTTEFAYLDGWLEGGNIALRPFGQGSLVGEIGESLGLTNAWTGEVDEEYGLGQTDIEGMSAVGEATLLYTGTVDPDGDILAELESNPIWTALPAVADGRVHGFPNGTWTFGGPRSTQQVIQAYVDVFTEQADQAG